MYISQNSCNFARNKEVSDASGGIYFVFINTFKTLKKMTTLFKYILTICSGFIGWFIGTFAPTFPLLLVAYAFIMWDVQSAWALDKRVHIKYPDRVKRHKAAFQSFKFGKMVNTFIRATFAILLMFAAHKWVMSGFWDVPLEYIAAAIVCGWQLLSVAENNASCPLEGERQSAFWIMLRSVLIDKTERHFDIHLDSIKHEQEPEE